MCSEYREIKLGMEGSGVPAEPAHHRHPAVRGSFGEECLLSLKTQRFQPPACELLFPRENTEGLRLHKPEYF